MISGILYFHQGWTDIFNCLPLINYYNNKYDILYILNRIDSEKIIKFYTKNLKNIILLFKEKIKLDNLIINNVNIKNYLIKEFKNYDFINSEYLGIGYSDIYRTDNYNNKFNNDGFFVTKFYVSYDIPYITRINNFIFNRDHNLENITYNNFISKYSKDYILYHQVINNYDKTKNIVNLDKISNIFFDYIKVLENAIEIHLLDSVWGTFIYMLDSKYKLFQNKKIYLYANRGYIPMFIDPIKLNNWIIL